MICYLSLMLPVEDGKQLPAVAMGDDCMHFTAAVAEPVEHHADVCHGGQLYHDESGKLQQFILECKYVRAAVLHEEDFPALCITSCRVEEYDSRAEIPGYSGWRCLSAAVRTCPVRNDSIMTGSAVLSGDNPAAREAYPFAQPEASEIMHCCLAEGLVHFIVENLESGFPEGCSIDSEASRQVCNAHFPAIFPDKPCCNIRLQPCGVFGAALFG